MESILWSGGAELTRSTVWMFGAKKMALCAAPLKTAAAARGGKNKKQVVHESGDSESLQQLSAIYLQ